MKKGINIPHADVLSSCTAPLSTAAVLSVAEESSTCRSIFGCIQEQSYTHTKLDNRDDYIP
jgi:hypothetical protein